MLTEDYLFVSQVLEEEKQEIQLLIANNTDRRYEFQPIITNQKSFKEHSYTFLDTSEDMVFLFISIFFILWSTSVKSSLNKLFIIDIVDNINFDFFLFL